MRTNGYRRSSDAGCAVLRPMPTLACVRSGTAAWLLVAVLASAGPGHSPHIVAATAPASITIPLREYITIFDAATPNSGEHHRIHLSEYYGTVAVGDPPQNFDVVFDTGSGNIVLPTVKCFDEACQKHHRFASQDSRTAVQLSFVDGTIMEPGDTRDKMTITYGTGKLTGEYIRDNVCIGRSADPSLEEEVHRACATVDFLGVIQESHFPFTELPFDGIFGLGLKGLSAGANFNFVGRLIANSLGDPVFAVFLRDLHADEDSEITFGHYRPERLLDSENGIRWLPVLRKESGEKGYWLVTMREIYVRDEPLGLCNDFSANPRCQVAMDTGTSLIMGPRHPVNRLLKSIGGCSGRLPPLRFVFDALGGDSFEMTLTQEDYSETSNDECAIAIQPIELPPTLGPMWVFGQTALRKYYSIYDAKRWRVGIGLARHSVQWRAAVPLPVTNVSNVGEICEDDNKDMVWNHLPGCQTFAHMGYCTRFSPLAHRYCRLSCELCTPQTSSVTPAVKKTFLTSSDSVDTDKPAAKKAFLASSDSVGFFQPVGSIALAPRRVRRVIRTLK